MSAIPQSERNYRAWLRGWVDGANDKTKLPAPYSEETLIKWYDEGRRRGAISRNNAVKEAQELFID